MIRMRTLVLALAVVVGASACGDDSVTPMVDPLEQFVGTWSATSFVYTSVDDPETSVPVLQVVEGASVAVAIATGGTFVASINLGDQTEGETVEIPGTLTHEGGNEITVSFAENPFFSDLDVTYAFQTANTLSWEAMTTFDFSQNGTPEPAVLNVVFQRN